MPNYKKLSDSYTDKRSEKSCQYALNLFSKPNYKNIKYILINKETESQEKYTKEISRGKYLRGADYFGKK